MDIREKLVELLGKNARCPKEVSNCHDCPYWADDVGCYEDEATADMLINSGVTMQEWIPVSERLPEEGKSVLVYFDSGNMAVGYWYDKDECISLWQIWTNDGWLADADCEPIYWMPLPQPPKGE